MSTQTQQIRPAPLGAAPRGASFLAAAKPPRVVIEVDIPVGFHHVVHGDGKHWLVPAHRHMHIRPSGQILDDSEAEDRDPAHEIPEAELDAAEEDVVGRHYASQGPTDPHGHMMQLHVADDRPYVAH